MSPDVERIESPRRPAAEDLTSISRRVAVPMAIGIALATLVSVAAGQLLTGSPGASLDRVDLEVVERLVVARTATIDRLSAAAMHLTDTLPVAILWAAAMAVGRWRTRGWTVPVFIFFVVGGDKLTYLLTNLVVGRPRPPVEPLGHVFETSSFPSGHVGSAVSLYGAIGVALIGHRTTNARRLPAAAIAAVGAAVVAVVAAVAFGRVYRGQHYPSDVVWGVLLGVVWLWCGWRLVLDGPRLRDGQGLRSGVDQVDIHGGPSLVGSPEDGSCARRAFPQPMLEPQRAVAACGPGGETLGSSSCSSPWVRWRSVELPQW